MTMITTGKIRGLHDDGVTAFKGIPYAKSPFGPLRMAAPVPVEPWDGTRDATTFGPRPPQPAVLPGMPEWSPADGLDCLTVNVWTPDPGGSGLPVMVWIYGGAYLTGAADMPEYDGARLAAEGVVVVSFNHRVGMEGYGHVDGAPPNRGLLDQLAALRWVQENAAAFGGDPGNVTVFGESAGAGGIACLMAMPSAAGLFRRAIAQSVAGLFFSPGLASGITGAIVDRLGGLSPYDSAPERLVAAATAVMTEPGRDDPARWGPMAYSRIPFAPVVDGEVLPDLPWKALAAGASRDVELIVGFTRDEYRFFQALGGAPVADLGTVMKTVAPEGADAAYRAAHPQATPEELHTLLMSDWMFRMPSALLADAHQGRTHAYELTWSPTPMGACHGLDVPLTFATLDCPLGRMLTGGAPEGEGLSRQFRTAWTGFAATGDPGWPAYDSLTATTHLFDVEPSDVSDPEAASRALWGERGIALLDQGAS
ncbi:carboxylesterase/lipase family protein [Nonomuraea dietziae]|uniref:Carboxylic ester hydrolase n=1 Tax=Nonomuraea dietziae TaxID=65515 RepID=A0A7W5V284_9ACTN|nr:carboxylesterase family protein [Nonomuraea dietziae]MBB3727529.1 para-nitrobenzyl esterase [Nonomuraea dietziae]